MNLKNVKNGFSNGLEEMGNKIEKDVKQIKMKEGSKYTINNSKIEMVEINLTLFGGSTDWGRTNLRLRLNSAEIQKKSNGYKVTISYESRMFDEFKDIVNLGGTKGNKELMGGKSYNVATKWLKTTKGFNVKTIDEISEKLRGGF